MHNKAEIDQFITGYECLGTPKMMMRYPDLMSSYFLVDIAKPTAGIDCIAALIVPVLLSFMNISFAGAVRTLFGRINKCTNKGIINLYIFFMEDIEASEGKF